jgi:hypothetical protein
LSAHDSSELCHTFDQDLQSKENNEHVGNNEVQECNTPNNNNNRLGGVITLQDNNKTKAIEIYA